MEENRNNGKGGDSWISSQRFYASAWQMWSEKVLTYRNGFIRILSDCIVRSHDYWHRWKGRKTSSLMFPKTRMMRARGKVRSPFYFCLSWGLTKSFVCSDHRLCNRHSKHLRSNGLARWDFSASVCRETDALWQNYSTSLVAIPSLATLLRAK